MSLATASHTGFAAALLKVVPPDARGNVVVSPWSVSSALAVLAAGVDDPARREIEDALAAGVGQGDVVGVLAADASRLVETAESEDDSVLEVVNRLWVDTGSTPRSEFLDQLGRWPGASVARSPMATEPEAARRLINDDAAEVTRGLIEEVLPAGSLTHDDRAVIVNALYLLVAWTEPFSEETTADEPFHAPTGTQKVPTLRGLREAVYAHDDWEYVALPLWLGLRVEILLPPTGTAPDAVALEPARLDRLRAGAVTHRVQLHLPRFRLETSADLLPLLKAVGISRIFEKLALTGVVAEEHLYISGAFHGAVLRLDEQGIEGAAVTALVGRAIAYQPLPEVEVRVDRPFVLVVTHPATGVVLFAARLLEIAPSMRT
jgi:serine protease inhibitor